MTAAAAAETYDEAERVLIWRADSFTELGVTDYAQALELALSDADLHAAQIMVERGCAPEMLHSILI